MPDLPPLPTNDEQRFLAHVGVIQWAQAICRARDRIIAAEQAVLASMQMPPRSMQNLEQRARWYQERAKGRETTTLAAGTERALFCNAAAKLLAYREWAADLGVFPSVDFSGIDAFVRQDIIDLRNMNEHITEYFGQPGQNGKAGGRDRARWYAEAGRTVADASAGMFGRIGNRLDFMAYAKAVEDLLPALLAESKPELSMPGTPV